MSRKETWRYPNPFFNLALSEQGHGNFERARIFFEDGLAFFRKTGSSHEIAWFLRYLANLSCRDGDLKIAKTLYQEALKIVQDLKDKFCLAHTLDGLAQVEDREGNYEKAALFAHQALKLCEQVGSKPRIAHAQWTLGLTLLNTDLVEAEQWLKSSLQIRIILQNKSDIADSLEALAKLNSLSGSSECAIKLFSVVDVLRKAISFAKTRAESSELDRYLNVLRVEVGNDAFITAWQEGCALGWEQAAKLALAEKTDCGKLDKSRG
jgi:tetratricopeptide (TPR) repeat protein